MSDDDSDYEDYVNEDDEEYDDDDYDYEDEIDQSDTEDKNYIILRGIDFDTDEGDIIASLPNYDDIVRVDVFDIYRFAIVKYRNKSSVLTALKNNTLTITSSSTGKTTTVTVDIPTKKELLARQPRELDIQDKKRLEGLLEVRKRDGDQAFLNDMALVGLGELVGMTRHIHDIEGPSDMYQELIRMFWRFGRKMKFEFDNLRLRLTNQLFIGNITYKQYKPSLTYYLISQLTGENYTHGKPIKLPEFDIFNFNMQQLYNKSKSGPVRGMIQYIISMYNNGKKLHMTTFIPDELYTYLKLMYVVYDESLKGYRMYNLFFSKEDLDINVKDSSIYKAIVKGITDYDYVYNIFVDIVRFLHDFDTSGRTISQLFDYIIDQLFSKETNEGVLTILKYHLANVIDGYVNSYSLPPDELEELSSIQMSVETTKTIRNMKHIIYELEGIVKRKLGY